VNLRPSPIAGRWYAGQATALGNSIDDYLARADVKPHPTALGIVAPHAGHLYSGWVAAHSFKAVGGNPVEIVVILCPSHFHDDAALITSAHDAYETPLGAIDINRSVLNQIKERVKDISWAELANDREHAIEIELPFLQRVFANGFTLVPLMMRDQSAQVAQHLGRALAKILQNKKFLIVASSDLSHYYPDQKARVLDAEMLKQVENFDPQGVLATEASGRGFACGHGAMAAMLWATKELGANKAQVLRYATSGEVSGDPKAVVGYGAAVVWKE
jgi:AmmeMemoRadiSam system protein B